MPGVYAKRRLAKLAVGWFKSERERERERKGGERKGIKKNQEGETLTANNIKTSCLPWSLGVK